MRSLLIAILLTATAQATTIRFESAAAKAKVERLISPDPLTVEPVPTVADVTASFNLEASELVISRLDYYTVPDLDGNRHVALSFLPGTYTLAPVLGDVTPPAQIGHIDVATAEGETDTLYVRVYRWFSGPDEGYTQRLSIKGTGTTFYEREFSPFDPSRFWAVGVVVAANLTATADITDDLRVDGLDLGILLSNFDQTAEQSGGDLNLDGTVDGLDLGILLADWTATDASPVHISAVPEPGTLLLLVLSITQIIYPAKW